MASVTYSLVGDEAIEVVLLDTSLGAVSLTAPAIVFDLAPAAPGDINGYGYGHSG